MKKGLIFDMDGTMVDNMMVHHYAWQQRLAQENLHLTIEEVMANCHGRNDETIQRLFKDKYNQEERDTISNEKEAIYRDIFKSQLRLIDGYYEFISMARLLDIPLGIGTAALIENVDFVLDELTIRHFFNTVLCEKDVIKGKPDPEVFLKAAAEMQIDPANALVFEDSPTGAEAARRAGMKVIIITTTHQPHEFEKFPNVVDLMKDYKDLKAESIFNYL